MKFGERNFITKAVFSSVGCKRKKNLYFESSQFEALNEVYLQNFFAQMGCKSRDESNDAN